MSKAPDRDSFRVIYYGGDRTTLGVADVWDYEAESDYALASRKVFHDEQEANAYAKELAKTNRLKLKLVDDGKHQYLD